MTALVAPADPVREKKNYLNLDLIPQMHYGTVTPNRVV